MPDAAAHVSARAELRRHLLVMVLGVVAVHAVGVALYYGLGVENRPTNFRRVFAGVWTVATLPVVLLGLSRVRAARLRARHARRQQQGR
jgi:predicted membrane protein